MSDILFQYDKVHPTTWVYLSSLLMIGLYFKFSRLWSVRNLDLIFLILLAPGMLLVENGLLRGSHGMEQAGYIWLFAMSGIFVVRLLLDPMMVRRPLLEPNLSVGGMTFLGASLLVFLMANVVNSKPERENPPPTGDSNLASQKPAEESPPKVAAPGYPALGQLPALSTQALKLEGTALRARPEADRSRESVLVPLARTIVILAHVAVVAGIVLVGYRHFDNIRTGIAAALLYLLVPYTAQMTGRWDHVLPAAFLVWALMTYRQPLISGLLLGAAIGAFYFPVFLLPLWIGFYWQRGLLRFLVGIVSALALLVFSLMLMSHNPAEFFAQVRQMFSWTAMFTLQSPEGFWSFDYIDSVYRIPVLAAFLALCGSLSIWPAQKNLGTLMSCSAAIMIGTQFWNAHGGGLYVAWYLPLMVLTIFRPNLEDRIALSVLGEGWLPRRRNGLFGVVRAA